MNKSLEDGLAEPNIPEPGGVIPPDEFLDLAPHQKHVYFALRVYGPMTHGEITDAIWGSKSTVTRSVGRLEDIGAISRRANYEDDGRLSVISAVPFDEMGGKE